LPPTQVITTLTKLPVSVNQTHSHPTPDTLCGYFHHIAPSSTKVPTPLTRTEYLSGLLVIVTARCSGERWKMSWKSSTLVQLQASPAARTSSTHLCCSIACLKAFTNSCCFSFSSHISFRLLEGPSLPCSPHKVRRCTEVSNQEIGTGLAKIGTGLPYCRHVNRHFTQKRTTGRPNTCGDKHVHTRRIDTR
jgi:hypothetical protein